MLRLMITSQGQKLIHDKHWTSCRSYQIASVDRTEAELLLRTLHVTLISPLSMFLSVAYAYSVVDFKVVCLSTRFYSLEIRTNVLGDY